mmetsp:Transcript_3223/g.9325  ORF Transcript_3223/g.9325 Transcript_3223/m.9325 type:complete len:260 (-) Transcript_3223:3951-4730(-)
MRFVMSSPSRMETLAASAAMLLFLSGMLCRADDKTTPAPCSPRGACGPPGPGVWPRRVSLLITTLPASFFCTFLKTPNLSMFCMACFFFSARLRVNADVEFVALAVRGVDMLKSASSVPCSMTLWPERFTSATEQRCRVDGRSQSLMRMRTGTAPSATTASFFAGHLERLQSAPATRSRAASLTPGESVTSVRTTPASMSSARNRSTLLRLRMAMMRRQLMLVSSCTSPESAIMIMVSMTPASARCSRSLGRSERLEKT